jgi:iron complex outermembrane recepter protein
MKSEWLDHRLRVNVDLFNTDYEDMQIPFSVSGSLGNSKQTNAGRARLRGFELDTLWAAADWLQLSGQYAYLDARVLEVRDISGNNVASDYPFPSAPRHSWVVAADATLLDSDWGRLHGLVTYSYLGYRKGTAESTHTLFAYLPAHHNLNLTLGLSDMPLGSGTLDVSTFVRNVTDEAYAIEAVVVFPNSDRSVHWNEPRTLGLNLAYRW